jgi:UDP-glucose 4-epimerase
MSRSVLVTGAAGFIGAHVARHCVELGFHVVGLDDLSAGFRSNMPESVEFVQGSINDPALIARLFEQHHFRFVYHLAGYEAAGLSHFIRRLNYQTNVLGSVNLINEAVKHEIECFVYASSITVYGAGRTPMTEDQPLIPKDPCGISKYTVELDLRAAHEAFGLSYIVFRMHNVYGELQNIGDRHRNVIGIFMNQVMENHPMTIFGDGTQTRAFTHVDDVAPTMARAPSVESAYNQVFNIGADRAYSVLEAAREVARAFNVQPRVENVPARYEVNHAFCKHDKLSRHFGAALPLSLEQGVARMAQWAKRQGPAPQVKFADFEIRKGLPPSWDV